MYTREQIDAEIENGNEEVINALLTGNIEDLISAPEEEVVEKSEEVVDTHTNDTEETSEVNPELAALQEELAFFKSKYEEVNTKKEPPVVSEAQAELQRELEEQKRLLAELQAQKEQAVKPEPITFNDDQDDVELADNYSKETRKNLERLASQAANKDDVRVLIEEINRLKEADAKREELIKQREAEELSKRQRRQLFEEIESFQKANNEFETPAPISQMFEEVSSFKDRIRDFVRSDDDREVEKAYYSIVAGNTAADEKLRAEIAKIGIEVPQGIDKYQQLTEIVDLKNGRRFNRFTGDLEDITDAYGNRVVQRSIEDAFKLSTYSERITEARIAAAKEVQKKLQDRENSAVVMDNSATVSGEDGKLGADAIKSILDIPDSQLKSNPELMKQYNRAMAELGIA